MNKINSKQTFVGKNKKFIAGFRIINVGVNVCTEEHL